MSHITCKYCGSADHVSGYGFACGVVGVYTICNGCDRILEMRPDTDGMTDAQAKAVKGRVAAWLAKQAPDPVKP